MPRTKKTGTKTKKSHNFNKESCNSNEIPIAMSILMLDKKIKTGEVTYKELLMNAEICAIDAYNLWSENKHKESLSFAIGATVLFEKLIEINYPLSKNNFEFMTLAQNIINKYK